MGHSYQLISNQLNMAKRSMTLSALDDKRSSIEVPTMMRLVWYWRHRSKRPIVLPWGDGGIHNP